MTFRQKNMALGAGTIIMAVAIYFFALQKTITLVQENQQMTEKAMTGSDLDKGIKNYQARLTDFKNNFGLLDSGGKPVSHEVILGQLSQFCNDYNLLLREFPSVMAHEENGYRIETNTIVVEGAFQNIVKLLYFFEREHKMGRIASVKFALQQDHKTQAYKLVGTIYVQNIKPLKDEV